MSITAMLRLMGDESDVVKLKDLIAMDRRIQEKELKKLWGLAAGRCSKCHKELFRFLDEDDPTNLGEMAHVIGFKEDAARGEKGHEGDNSYENLILLCPTCHTEVDKAAVHYPASELLKIKRAWEREVSQRLSVPHYATLRELCKAIWPKLCENKAIWEHCGPQSRVAITSRISAQAMLWELSKLAKIVPNNKGIIALCEGNSSLLTVKLCELFAEFKVHADQFERGCYRPLDEQKRFPVEFEQEVLRHANNG